MSKLGVLGLAVQYFPRVVQIRRRTWIILGVALLLLAGLAIAAVVASVVWLVGQAAGMTGSLQEFLNEPVRVLMQGVDHWLLVAREFMAESLGSLLPENEQDAGAPGNAGEAEN